MALEETGINILKDWVPSSARPMQDRLIGSMAAIAQNGTNPDFGRMTVLPDGNGAVPFCVPFPIAAASVPVTINLNYAFFLYSLLGVSAPSALLNQFGYSGDSSTITWDITDVSVVIQETGMAAATTYSPVQIETLLSSYWLQFGQGNNIRYISLQECGRVGSVDVAATAISTDHEHSRVGMFSDRGVWHADGTGIPLRQTNDRGQAQLVCGRTHGITVLASSIWTVWIKGFAWNANIDLQGQTGSKDPCANGGGGNVPATVNRMLQRFGAARLTRWLGR